MELDIEENDAVKWLIQWIKIITEQRNKLSIWRKSKQSSNGPIKAMHLESEYKNTPC